MTWRFKILQIDPHSNEFHEAIKNETYMTIEADGKIRHDSPRKDQLAAKKGKFYGDFFRATVTLGDGPDAHEHVFILIRGPEILGKRLFAGEMTNMDQSAKLEAQLHNGTWHGIG